MRDIFPLFPGAAMDQFSISTSKLLLLVTTMTLAACGAGASSDDTATTHQDLLDRGSTEIGTVVHVESGDLQGALVGATAVFEGVPYAAPPTGELRWRAPAPVAHWSGVRDALAFANECPQLSSGAVVGAEDCLDLNVWAPTTSPPGGRPVMVWIHGGGNHQGASFAGPPIDGQYWSETQGVVFVSIGYRLGALGFLAHPALDAENHRHISGNYGLLDQIAALRWIQRNIASFGGDPRQVLVFGQSAGADDICVLLTTPLARGLFARAILESSYSGCGAPSLALMEQTTGTTVVANAGCAAATDVAACLRALPVDTIVSALPGQLDLNRRIYSPAVDGFVVPDVPLNLMVTTDNATDREIVIGTNSGETATRVGTPIPDEATYESRLLARYGATLAPAVLAEYPAANFPTPQDAFITATTDEIHTCPARSTARLLSRHGPVHRYFFTHAVENNPTLHAEGAFHTLELDFVFRVFSAFPFSADETALADAIDGYWGAMGRTGQPNGGGRVFWPGYDAHVDPYLQLDSTIAAHAGLRSAQCDFWDGISMPPTGR